MRKKFLFLIIFYSISTVFFCFSFSEKVIENWVSLGWNITNDYPWRSVSFQKEMHHIAWVDVSQNTFTIFTTSEKTINFSNMTLYFQELREVLLQSGLEALPVSVLSNGFLKAGTATVSGIFQMNTENFSFEMEPYNNNQILLKIEPVRSNTVENVSASQPAVRSLGSTNALSAPEDPLKKQIEKVTEELALATTQLNEMEAIRQLAFTKEKANLELQGALLIANRLNQQLWSQIFALEEVILILRTEQATLQSSVDKKMEPYKEIEILQQKLVQAEEKNKTLAQQLQNKDTFISGQILLLQLRDQNAKNLESVVEDQKKRIVDLQAQILPIAAIENQKPELQTVAKTIESEALTTVPAENATTTSPLPTKPLPKLLKEVVYAPEKLSEAVTLEYSYADSGVVKSVKIKDAKAAILQNIEHIYDSENRLIQLKTYENLKLVRSEEYSFESDGKLKIETKEASTLKSIQKLEKNDNDLITRISFYKPNGDLEFYQEFLYDKEILTQVVGYTAAGKAVTRTVHRYNEKNLLQETVFYESDQLKTKELYEYSQSEVLKKKISLDEKDKQVEIREFYYAP